MHYVLTGYMAAPICPEMNPSGEQQRSPARPPEASQGSEVEILTLSILQGVEVRILVCEVIRSTRTAHFRVVFPFSVPGTLRKEGRMYDVNILGIIVR